MHSRTKNVTYLVYFLADVGVLLQAVTSVSRSREPHVDGDGSDPGAAGISLALVVAVISGYYQPAGVELA